MALLHCIDLIRSFKIGEIEVQALRGVTVAIEQGEFSALVGPSGSGKTTLLNQIGCLDTPTSGRVELDGEIVSSLDANRRADIRRDSIGFIFQTFNLIPTLSARENVAFPLLIQKSRLTLTDHRAVDDLLDRVDLGEQRDKRPDQMSGGQRQRVAVARALIKKPRLVLADEPTANLDSVTGEAVLTLMRELNQESGTTFIFSTHDAMVMRFARRLVRLHDGSIVSDESVSGKEATA